MQHASTHDQRGSTESTWHGKLHGQVCAELDGKANTPETTATREERLAVGSRSLGAVLLQEHDGNWLPVAFISRAMTSAEKNYAQIEKELLGLVFACEKFHEYVYGATVIGETDHKPLVSLHKKNLCDLTPRLQRMMLRLRRYDLKLEFKPGKYLIVADILPRAFDRSVKKSNKRRSKHTWI